MLALALLAATTSACSLTSNTASPAPTRVVTWNVLRGFLDRTQVEPAQQWLREHLDPVEHVAYSYLVYDVPQERIAEIEAAVAAARR